MNISNILTILNSLSAQPAVDECPECGGRAEVMPVAEAWVRYPALAEARYGAELDGRDGSARLIVCVADSGCERVAPYLEVGAVSADELFGPLTRRGWRPGSSGPA